MKPRFKKGDRVVFRTLDLKRKYKDGVKGLVVARILIKDEPDFANGYIYIVKLDNLYKSEHTKGQVGCKVCREDTLFKLL